MSTQQHAASCFLRCTLVCFMLALGGAVPAAAQTNPPPEITLGASDFPRWAHDIRRWEIIAFGSFPFTMFTATFAMDTYRWVNANNMDWSDEGRRYAPWPLKSAGAVNMENHEYEMTIGIAAGMSLAVAMADLIIVQVKRHKARQRAEALPAGTAIITRKPWPADGNGEEDGGDPVPDGEDGEAAPDAP